MQATKRLARMPFPLSICKGVRCLLYLILITSHVGRNASASPLEHQPQESDAQSSGATAEASEPDDPGWAAGTLATRDDVSEALFLVRWADVAIAEALAASAAPDALGETLAEQRLLLARNRERAAANGMPEEIIAYHDAVLKHLDIYCDFLIDAELLQEDFQRQHKQLDDKAFADGFVEGAPTGFGLAMAGVEPMSAAIVLGAQAIGKYNEQRERHENIDAARNASLRQRVDAYQRASIAQLAKISALAPKIAACLACTEDEVGLSIADDEAKAFAAAVAEDDQMTLLDMLSSLIDVRPRDAFVRRERGVMIACLALSYASAKRPVAEYRGLVSHAVDDLIQASRLIPSGAYFDRLRSDLLGVATIVAAIGCEGEALDSDELRRLADVVCLCADAAARHMPRSQVGPLMQAKGYALAKAGKHQEALDVMMASKEVIGDGPDVDLTWARILSLAGNLDEGFGRLKAARNKGFADIRALRTDADLKAVRAAHAGAFDRLVKPIASSELAYGVVWNDFQYRNTSDFPLTAVVVRLTRVGSSSESVSECYWVPALAAGSAMSWQGVLDGASQNEERVDKRRVELWCNESRRSFPRQEPDVVGRYRGIATISSVEGDDVKETSDISLDASVDGDGLLRIQIRGHGGGDGAVWSGMKLSDNIAFADAEGGEMAAIILFDSQWVFGCFRADGDRENNVSRAFVAERVLW